jgi:integrase
VFSWPDSRTVTPEYMSARFKALARAADLPVIRLHDGRHTAATLARRAGLDLKLVSEQLGHSTAAITADLYQHVLPEEHDEAARWSRGWWRRLTGIEPARRGTPASTVLKI